jgi:hypothetical protein
VPPTEKNRTDLTAWRAQSNYPASLRRNDVRNIGLDEWYCGSRYRAFSPG